MTPPEPTTVGPDEAGAFLAEHLGHTVIVELLGAGMWSRAFAFRHDGRDLVARFGQHRRGLADPCERYGSSPWIGTKPLDAIVLGQLPRLVDRRSGARPAATGASR